ncbi:MAG: EamA family transporter [Methylobacterium sp.]|uniref:EamA family transporter n=1 Tax=Methylobacterium sp. TaxID=409 RepID=UPI0025F5E561|nr:EamA family transporter [Methylobacterium sp.]MBX9930418.1 EamA family transporter [Methylobacterium sp.]
MSAASLPLRDVLLAVAVVTVWGTNFVVMRVGLDHLPPLLFAALRFLFAALPGVLLLPRPQVSWANLAAYGLLIGTGQFGLLFVALSGHISPGLASLVIQLQVFFTIGLSIALTGERVRGYQWAALALAASGIGVIAAHTDATTTPLGLALVALAAMSWASGNTVAKAGGVRNMLPYVIWGSLFSAPPLFVLSFAVEGWDAIRDGLARADVITWGTVLWQAVGNVMFGYAVWGWLLARHPAALITPMALLVPVFGMGASAFWLGESLPAWKIGAALLVMGGLAIGVLYPRWRDRAAATRLPPAV